MKTIVAVGLITAGTAYVLARSRAGTRAARFALPRLADRAWTLPVLPAVIDRQWEKKMQPGDVVMLGDSITEGADWAALLPQTRVHNHGIGGDDTVGVLRRLDLVTRAQPA